MKNKILLILGLMLLIAPMVSSYADVCWDLYGGERICINSSSVYDGISMTSIIGQENASWNEVYADTLYYDISNPSGYISSYSETDPIYSAWDKSTGISITESQISDLSHTIDTNETTRMNTIYGWVFSNHSLWDEAYSWGDHASEGYLTSYSETDPIYSAWDKSTGISITESQISDLSHTIDTNETTRMNTIYGWVNTNHSLWDEAYLWGDHSLEGYLTSYSETDPIANARIDLLNNDSTDSYYNSENNLTNLLNDNYVDVSGDLMTGTLDMSGNQIHNISKLVATDGSYIGFGSFNGVMGVDNSLTFYNNQTVVGGAIVYSLAGVGNETYLMMQSGQNHSAGILGNSWMIIPNDIANKFDMDARNFTNCIKIHNFYNKTVNLACDTGGYGASLIVQGGIDIWRELFVGEGINVNGSSIFNLGGQDLNIVDGDIYISKQRIEEVGLVAGDWYVIRMKDFEDGVLNPLTKVTDNSIYDWSVKLDNNCHNNRCVTATGGGTQNNTMVANVSTLNYENLNLTFWLQTNGLDINDNFYIYSNNNEGSGDILLYNITDGSDVSDTKINLNSVLPSSMDNKTVITFKFILEAGLTNEDVFIDDLQLDATAISTDLTNVTRFDGKIKSGDGTAYILYNDSSKEWQFSPNSVSFNDVTLTTQNITGNSNIDGNLTVGDKIFAEDWTNVSITENQISDLNHTIDTNETVRVDILFTNASNQQTQINLNTLKETNDNDWNKTYADSLYYDLSNPSSYTDYTSFNFTSDFNTKLSGDIVIDGNLSVEGGFGAGGTTLNDGSIWTSGDLFVGGELVLIDSSSLNGSILVDYDSVYTIGNSTHKFADVWADTLHGSITESQITDLQSYLLDSGDTATGDYTFDTDTFFIDSTNNKIGIGTTNPTSTLYIEDDGVVPQITLFDDDQGATNEKVDIKVQSGIFSIGLADTGSAIDFQIDGSGDTTLNGALGVAGTVTMPTPFTLGATSVTSTGTQLNYLSSATGTTGTANVVLSNSPTLVTPDIGVATGTSLTLNEGSLTLGDIGAEGGQIDWQNGAGVNTYFMDVDSSDNFRFFSLNPTLSIMGVTKSDGTVSISNDLDVTGDVAITSAGTNTVPSLALGVTNSGFYTQSSGGTLAYSRLGTPIYRLQSSGLDFILGGGPKLMRESSSSTNPTVLPVYTDEDTGIGGNNANVLYLVAGGTTPLQVNVNTGSSNAVHVVGSGTGTGLLSDMDGNGIAFKIDSEATTADGLYIDLIGTGTGLVVDGASTGYSAIFNNGNVGIGTTTPAVQFEVSKSTTASADGIIRIVGGDTAIAELQLYADQGAGGSDRLSIVGTDTPLSQIEFKGNNIPFMRITASGNACMGANCKTDDAFGLIVAEGTASRIASLRLDDTITTNNGVGRFTFGANGTINNLQAAYIQGFAPSDWGVGDTPLGLQFATTNEGSTTATVKMDIFENGVRRYSTLATAPATCSIGDAYVDTSGAYCACGATNTWSNMIATGTCT